MSRQLGLVFDRAHTAQVFIATKPEYFREGFDAWLSINWPIYEAFEREAHRVWRGGRRHFGANTIIEHLRFETLTRDKTAEFKLDDRWTSSIARLYGLLNPERATLFEFRERRDGVVKTPDRMKVA